MYHSYQIEKDKLVVKEPEAELVRVVAILKELQLPSILKSSGKPTGGYKAISGLTPRQVEHIKFIVDDLRHNEH